MIKDVIIDIKSSQDVDGEINSIEFTTEGRYGQNGNEYFISYAEGELFDTGEEVQTKIFIKSDNSVILQRTGSLKSRILIEKDKRNSSLYALPYGQMTIGVFGEKLEFNLNENGGSIKLVYTIDQELSLLSRNTVNITIRGVK